MEDATNSACGLRIKEAKVHTLKSEFVAIHKKDGESINDFAVKLTMIVTTFVH